MNCTTQNVGQNAQWSIQLAGRGAVVQFVNKGNINLLYSRGFYNLTDVTENDGNKTIRLFINNTVAEQEGNNGTVVTCLNVNEGTKLSETILVLYGELVITVYSPNSRHFGTWTSVLYSGNSFCWKVLVKQGGGVYKGHAQGTLQIKFVRIAR